MSQTIHPGQSLPPAVDDAIARIHPYEPGKPISELERERGRTWPGGVVKLASNENPLGPSPLGIVAASRALAEAHRYPDGGSHQLREALSRHLGLPPDHVVPGQGSNELIELIVQTYCTAGEEVLAPAYSFSCYRLASEAHRTPYREAPLGERFAVDIAALLAAVTPATKVVFLANPNNPTGTYVTAPAFAELCAKLPAHIILCVDEAYLEYVRAADYPDGIAALGARERLILLRTFSKAYGLAALRVGYAIGRPAVIGWMHRVRMAFNVATPAQVGAARALDDREHVAAAVALNRRELPRMAERLLNFGFEVLPSQGNFLLVAVPGGIKGGARALYEKLLDEGVIVRPLGGYALPNHLRITVGTEAENARLYEALARVLRQGRALKLWWRWCCRRVVAARPATRAPTCGPWMKICSSWCRRAPSWCWTSTAATCVRGRRRRGCSLYCPPRRRRPWMPLGCGSTTSSS